MRKRNTVQPLFRRLQEAEKVHRAAGNVELADLLGEAEVQMQLASMREITDAHEMAAHKQALHLICSLDPSDDPARIKAAFIEARRLADKGLAFEPDIIF